MLRNTHLVTIPSLVAIMGCAGDPASPRELTPVVAAVSPAGGASGVSRTSPVVLTFTHPMMPGTEMNVVLHQGTVTGPAIAGTATWSVDRKTLTFTPSAPLASATTYVLHLAPTLISEGGQRVDHRACAGLGGENVTSGMMGGGMMGGGSMGQGMMGPGWGMANGSYGMIFTFTTA